MFHRCPHGMTRGLCVVETCEHWDRRETEGLRYEPDVETDLRSTLVGQEVIRARRRHTIKMMRQRERMR
jgi:hypothetical protein